jgi:hypothetical protein
MDRLYSRFPAGRVRFRAASFEVDQAGVWKIERPAASDIFLTEGLRPSSVHLDASVKSEETDWRDYLD